MEGGAEWLIRLKVGVNSLGILDFFVVASRDPEEAGTRPFRHATASMDEHDRVGIDKNVS